MDKRYSVNGKIYIFTDVHAECGELCGECITAPYFGKVAWLYSDGFQFSGRRRVDAREITERTVTDNSYTMWGGQLRDKLPHGARYYQNPRGYRK